MLALFHPLVARWFTEKFGAPTPPQERGWPLIAEGRHVLVAAPTGTGKTLTGFLWAIDALMRQGAELPDACQVLYVSPLRALSNDVQKNLAGPLAELAGLDPEGSAPSIRVMVRTGDTTASDRAAMMRRAPHILVTTPESLYILLTSAGGRKMLGSVRTVIVDEIHALARDKRGTHLALSLERLEELAGAPVQRIGLSATVKPLERMGRFLGGPGREVALVDVGHRRKLDVALEIPRSPLAAVCSHEVWEEIYQRMAELVREHKTTLVFVNTRAMCERIAAQLAKLLGEDQVGSHHGSLSKERRLDAEQRLKEGKLKALVATASLELGIDIGDVDLALQVGATRSIATFLQRVGRAGHALRAIPKGRIFPLTIDELIEAAALLRATIRGDLDRTPIPERALDILAQQIVAECVAREWKEEELYAAFRRSDPYRDLSREDFDAVVALHTDGRRALLHRDGVNRRLMATRRARITAITAGGAIPDTADYQVLLEPEGTLVGTLNEDFAIESNAGDIFQLGNTSWRILRVQPGVVRVADAKGQPPTLPFWLGEAPGRTIELSKEASDLRAQLPADDGVGWLVRESGIPEGAAIQIAEFVAEGRRVLGAVPSQEEVIAERFFDESGGMQLVIHAPFGSRINRAWGLALRKRFCRRFGFELQAAANEESIVLSLGPHSSFPLEEVFHYLAPQSARHVLVQALLAAPMFETRWRWNASRALLLERTQRGRRVPAPIQRMRAGDLLASAFPQVQACPENLPGGDIPIPEDHPIVRQTVEDCLTEGMDVDGFLRVLTGLESGAIATRAIDTAAPSVFAHGILSARPYAFLDDAPLEERRTQAVMTRRVLDDRTADEMGALDPEAVARVKEEAWPSPESAEEVHEALLWMGFVTNVEAEPWGAWLAELAAARRVTLEEGCWRAVEASRDPRAVWKGRLEALGPVESDDPVMLELESEGFVLRTRLLGKSVWCERRLLARIHRYTLERLRREIEPVSASMFLRFLAAWQHVAEGHRLEGPQGVREVVRQLAGFEVPAAAWEASVLPARVKGYRREWLDELTLAGEVVWGRLWGSGPSPIRVAPMALLPREELDGFLGLAGAPQQEAELSSHASTIHEALLLRGALFPQELARHAGLLPSHLEMGISELISAGLLTCDSFGPLRQLLVPPSRRRRPLDPRAPGGPKERTVLRTGRFSLFRRETPPPPELESVARLLLARTGVVFRRTITRERIPVPWRDLVRVYRSLERRGEVRGGRFVAGFDGEQYALPHAVTLLRDVRRKGDEAPPLSVPAADPLNFRGILTPDERVAPTTRTKVLVG